MDTEGSQAKDRADIEDGEVELALPDFDGFFVDSTGEATVIDETDLIRTVRAYDASEIPHLELAAYDWLYRPYSMMAVYRNTLEDEHRYFVVEPWLDEQQASILAMLKEKVPNSIDTRDAPIAPSKEQRIRDIQRKSQELLQRHGYLSGGGTTGGFLSSLLAPSSSTQADVSLSAEAVERLQYYLIRDFINYGPIEPLRHDVNIEDISCNGPGEQTFVDHAQYGEIVTNVSFSSEEELQRFVKGLAGKAGKGISKRQPEVDARLPDGSRAKLILGTEITEKGSAFTIRQFKEVPFTPVDLICWQTFSLEQMAYLWLAIEHGKSGIIAGGTSSGKTTSLNACSLFMPGNQKVVSIEDTPELNLPQSNWVPHTTRESFHGEASDSSYSAYRLLKGALRENPDYLIMGEVRGEQAGSEGQTLFQTMSSGHWTYTTFHANSPQELVNRFTSEPINVSPTQFASLDWITIQRQQSLYGTKVRRATSVTEVGAYDKQRGETEVSTVYEWDPTEDQTHKKKSSELLEEVRQENGWRPADLERELAFRKIVLAYLAYHGINSYAAVAATIQAYMARPEKVLSLIAQNDLDTKIANIAEKDYINIDIDEAAEAQVPRPRPSDQLERQLQQFLESQEHLLVEFLDLDTDLEDTSQRVSGDADAGEGDADTGGIVVRSPGMQTTVGEDHPAMGGGDPMQPALEGDTSDQAVDLDPHLGLFTGQYTIEDGEIRREIRKAEEEFSDLYDDEGFGEVVDDDSDEAALDEETPTDPDAAEMIRQTVQEMDEGGGAEGAPAEQSQHGGSTGDGQDGSADDGTNEE